MTENNFDANKTTLSQMQNYAGGTINYGYSYWQPYVEHFYYPIYTTTWQPRRNMIEQAFSVVRVLIDKKIINPEKMTVKKFIGLVTDLSKAI